MVLKDERRQDEFWAFADLSRGMEWDSHSNQWNELFLIWSETQAQCRSHETQQVSSWSTRWQAGWCGWARPGGVTIRPPRWPDKDSRPVRLNLTGHSAPMGSPLSTSDSPPPPDRLTWSHYHSPALSCYLHFYNFLAHFTQSTK